MRRAVTVSSRLGVISSVPSRKRCEAKCETLPPGGVMTTLLLIAPAWD
jgi:hypothetical protein